MKSLFFSIPGYEHIRDALIERLNGELGEVERRCFADGEHYQRVLQSVEGRDVILVGGTDCDSSTLLLYDLACAITQYGARRLILVVPYFGYATMERAVHSGEVVTAKTRARLLSAIPRASYGNTILLLDLHSEGIPHYFESGMAAFHVYAKGILTPVIKDLGGDNFVLASTDAGRAKWVESLANDLCVDAAFLLKRRDPDGTTHVTAMNADVRGRKVIIYDDMVRSGGSLMNAARTYLDAGAASLSAVCTHGVFTDGAFEAIQASHLFEHFVTTDSHPRAVRLNIDGLHVVSTVELFASQINKLQRS